VDESAARIRLAPAKASVAPVPNVFSLHRVIQLGWILGWWSSGRNKLYRGDRTKAANLYQSSGVRQIKLRVKIVNRA